jgi:phage-related protein
MPEARKPLGWLRDSLHTPPIGLEARRNAGTLLRMLQEGEQLAFPDSRPMPEVGARVHELRVRDRENSSTWRILYRIDSDAILVIDWFSKKTQKTPKSVIDTCKARLKRYDGAAMKGRSG